MKFMINVRIIQDHKAVPGVIGFSHGRKYGRFKHIRLWMYEYDQVT